MHATVKVWDPLVRIFHWSLVACFAVAWISADEWQDLHEICGYTIAALVVFRLVWGLAGPRHARFGQFVHRPHKVLEYLKTMRHGREARYLGHNPAGGMMVLGLLAGLAVLTLTGWLQTDIFWGEDWVSELHELMANALLTMAALHVGGVLLASLRHRENLVRAMLTGRKRAPSHSDVD